MENQITAPKVQFEQTENAVQNSTERQIPANCFDRNRNNQRSSSFKDLIPESFREENLLKSLLE